MATGWKLSYVLFPLRYEGENKIRLIDVEILATNAEQPLDRTHETHLPNRTSPSLLISSVSLHTFLFRPVLWRLEHFHIHNACRCTQCFQCSCPCLRRDSRLMRLLVVVRRCVQREEYVLSCEAGELADGDGNGCLKMGGMSWPLWRW